jgi:hypothetical protein
MVMRHLWLGTDIADKVHISREVPALPARYLVKNAGCPNMEGRGYGLIVFACAWLPTRSGPVCSSGRGSGRPMSFSPPVTASDPGRAS